MKGIALRRNSAQPETNINLVVRHSQTAVQSNTTKTLTQGRCPSLSLSLGPNLPDTAVSRCLGARTVGHDLRDHP